MNFTGESTMILIIFAGMALVSFFMSLPYLLSKEVLREDEKK